MEAAALLYAVIVILLTGGVLGWLGLRDRLPSAAFKARMEARRAQAELARVARETAAQESAARDDA